MKKAVMVVLIIGICLVLCAPAMAKREFKGRPDAGEFGGGPPDRQDRVGSLAAPQNFTFTAITDDSICFTWDPVEGADKYSVDIEFDVEPDGDGETDTTVEFSFGTGDRTDGEDPSDPNLCVLLTDLADEGEQLYGTFSAKVKGLNPGKGRGRQNHPFSAALEFTLTPPGDPLTMQ